MSSELGGERGERGAGEGAAEFVGVGGRVGVAVAVVGGKVGSEFIFKEK